MDTLNFKSFQERATVNMSYRKDEAVAQNMALGYTATMAEIMERAESVNLEFVNTLGAAGVVCGAAKKLYSGDKSSKDVAFIEKGLSAALTNIAVLAEYFSIPLEDVAKTAYDSIKVFTPEGTAPADET